MIKEKSIRSSSLLQCGFNPGTLDILGGKLRMRALLSTKVFTFFKESLFYRHPPKMY